MRYFFRAFLIFCCAISLVSCSRFNHDQDYLKNDAMVSGLQVPMGANLPKEENYYIVPLIPPNTKPRPVSLIPPGSHIQQYQKPVRVTNS